MNGRQPKDTLESLLTVSNKRPKSNFSNPKIVSSGVVHTDVTITEALELLKTDPCVFMHTNTNEVSFAPLVKGQHAQTSKVVQYRLMMSNPMGQADDL